MNPHVITGCGVVSTLGIGRQAFLAGMASDLGSGAGPDSDGTPVETFDASKYADVRLAEVRGFDPKKYLGDKGLRSLDRLSKLLIVATRLALDDAAIKTSGSWLPPSADGERPWADRVGLVVANAYGSLEAISELDRVALLEDPRYINPARFPLTVSNSAAGYASIWEDVRALNVTVSGWSCGALDAMACSDLMLEAGRADVLLVGGAEAMTEALFVGFHRLGLQSLTTATVPRGAGGAEGSRRPHGARLGEGAALVALETRKSALSRNATRLAEIAGYGTSFAPPRHTASLVHASADALEIAILDALADAQTRPADVDLVVSSLSGLAPFDDAELAAIRRVMGDSVPVTAPKFDLGETLGASGAMAIMAAIAHLNDAAPARPVHGRPPGAVGTTLLTAMGYYGSASALVLRRASR